MPSIRQKLIFGYYAFSGLFACLAVFAYLELNFLEERIEVYERIAGFFDTTLEMRQQEKNYFLYREADSFQKTLSSADKAQRMLGSERSAFLRYATDAKLHVLEADLKNFIILFREYRDAQVDAAARNDLEQGIRTIGHRISDVAREISKVERADLRATMKAARITLVTSVILLSLFGIGIGQILSRQAVRPLRLLEESMRPIAKGTFSRLEIPVKDREIVSFTNAFNRMLQEHDLRLQHLIQSEKLVSLGTLVSGVAHELNNPLGNISTACQILIEELGQADLSKQKELLTQIDEQVERARSTVLALLDFSRDANFQKEPVAVLDLVEKTLVFLKQDIPESVTVSVDIPPELMMWADRRKMQQVVLNLVKNASDAMRDGGAIEIKGRRYTSTQDIYSDAVYVYGPKNCDYDGSIVVLTIADNGPGIAKNNLPRIFDPFFTTRDVGHGSGLGLFIVQEIVQQHEGCIGVVSEENQGAKFFIKIPDDLDQGDLSAT